MQNTSGCFGIPKRSSPPTSEVCYTASGVSYGSVNTFIRYYPTPTTVTGTAILPVSTAALGTIYYIQEPGIYSITAYGDYNNASVFSHAITRNNPVLNGTTNIANYMLTVFDVAAATLVPLNITLRLFPNDYVAVQMGISTSASSPPFNAAGFRIVKISD